MGAHSVPVNPHPVNDVGVGAGAGVPVPGVVGGAGVVGADAPALHAAVSTTDKITICRQ